jgi:hypothetical protein
MIVTIIEDIEMVLLEVAVIAEDSVVKVEEWVWAKEWEIEDSEIGKNGSGSGSLATLSEALDASGDIIALRPEGKFLVDIFSIELKTGYDKTNFHQHLKSNNKSFEIEKFWEQCIDDARKADKHGMLIYRKKGYNIIVGIEQIVDDLISEKIKLSLRSITLKFQNDKPTIIFYDFEEFFEVVTPNIIEELWQV